MENLMLVVSKNNNFSKYFEKVVALLSILHLTPSAHMPKNVDKNRLSFFPFA
jgi:hypothetical protein